MSRKKVKLILLIAGLAAAGTGLAVQMLNTFRMATQGPSFMPDMNGFISVFSPAFILIFAGIVPLTIVSLMHSRDIRDTKRGLSNLLKGLAYFWIITGTLNAIALIIISIFFIK